MSRFSGLIATRQKPEFSATQKGDASVPAPAAATAEEPAAQPIRRGPGRPRSKRSDPAYTQVTAYIRKETHRAIKSILFNQEDEREFSDLVEQLLTDYTQTRHPRRDGSPQQ